MNCICKNCIDIQNKMTAATLEPHKSLLETYYLLKQMYDAKKLYLVIADYKFDNFIEEVFDELHYTYVAILQCPKCKTYFKLGVCIRGVPIYEIFKEKPDLQQFADMAKRDKKIIYIE